MTASLDELRKGAVEALRRGDGAGASALLEQAIAAGVKDAGVWLALARARGMGGDAAGRAQAIEAALGANPRSISALVAKGDLLVETGKARSGVAFYAAALRSMPNFDKLPADQQQDLLRAKAANEKYARDFEDHIRARLTQAGVDGANAPPRFAQAVDILVGRSQAYVQAPRIFYFPELPQIQFYPPESFEWTKAIEATALDIRNELQGAIGKGDGFSPYVTSTASRPPSSQRGLADNADWSAYFLIKDGAPTVNAQACPRTLEALAHAPSPQIAHRTPHTLFSKLAAGAHIPPHTGVLNVRLICHLALIVPPDCGLRVGNQVRFWEEGKCLVFDDTIEHEAWNRSTQDRYVLIFDVWRPELTEDERVAVSELCAAVDSYGGAPEAWHA